MAKISITTNQIEEWVGAARVIERHFGIDRAMGYLIGGKFYDVVSLLHASRRMMRSVEDEKEQTDHTSLPQKVCGSRNQTDDTDEPFAQEKETIVEIVKLLTTFTELIKNAFGADEIRRYLESHPRLGAMRHVSSGEDYVFMVSKGAIKHSIENEVEDALIFGDILNYFGINV